MRNAIVAREAERTAMKAELNARYGKKSMVKRSEDLKAVAGVEKWLADRRCVSTVDPRSRDNTLGQYADDDGHYDADEHDPARRDPFAAGRQRTRDSAAPQWSDSAEALSRGTTAPRSPGPHPASTHGTLARHDAKHAGGRVGAPW